VAKPGGSIVISWSAPSWATSGYSIRRSTSSSGPFTQIGTTAAGVTTYTDTGTANGTTYYYVVRGLSGQGGTGQDSAVASATSDSASPQVSSTVPANAATGVSVAQSITVNFSQPMETALTGVNFSLVPCTTNTCSSPGAAVSGTQTWLTSQQLFFTPDIALSQSQWYGIKLTTSATDATGNALSISGCPHPSGTTICYWTFQTGTCTSTSGVSAAAPGNGSTGAGTNARITMLFTSNLTGQGQLDAMNGFQLQQTSGTGSPCYVYNKGTNTNLCARSGGSFTAPVTNGGQFIPTNPLKANTNYTFSEVANDPGNLVDPDLHAWCCPDGQQVLPHHRRQHRGRRGGQHDGGCLHQRLHHPERHGAHGHADQQPVLPGRDGDGQRLGLDDR
jgi:Bacterial Ig-like domain